MVPLAQLATSTQTSIDLIKWVGLLIVLVLIGGWAVLHVRRRLFQEDKHEPLGVLEQLRQAVRDGEMTQEELEQAKRAMSAKLRGETGGASGAGDAEPRPPQTGDEAAQPNAEADGTRDTGPDDSPDDPPKA